MSLDAHGAHDTARACVDGTIGARTTRSAALGRHDDSLAARRSLGVAGVGSDRAEPAMRRESKRRGDVTRHTAHTTRRARVSTARSAHARRGRRRSVGTTTRSRLGARSASPVSALTEPNRRCDAESKRRGDVTRHTAHTTRRARVSTARSAHARRGRRRSVGTTTRSRLGARSASPVSALTEPNRRCDERARGAVMSLDTRRTRHGARVCRRHDRRTHDEVGGARSARRLARGSALARRRRCRL